MPHHEPYVLLHGASCSTMTDHENFHELHAKTCHEARRSFHGSHGSHEGIAHGAHGIHGCHWTYDTHEHHGDDETQHKSLD